jgi:D-alanyl-D-alanine dipeptidase
LKGFIQNLLDAGIEGSDVATVTHTDHDHGAAVDVAFVAPLAKFHKLGGLDNLALSAEFTKFSPHPRKSISGP